MAGLPWIKVSVDLPRHKKSMLLAARLDDPKAWVYVVQFWCWIAEHEATGDIEGPDAAVLVARGAGWAGDVDEFCRHMVAVKFLDLIPGGFHVHDWDEWAGAHVTKKQKDAARKAKSREEQAQSPDSPQPVTRMSRGHDADKCDISGERGEERVESRDPPSLLGKADALAGLYPETQKLIDASSDLFAFSAQNKTRQGVERAIAAVGVDKALVAAQASYAKIPKRHLGWHLDAILASAVSTPVTTTDPTVDLSWVEQLPELRRSEALIAWEAKAADVRKSFNAEAIPRVLVNVAEALRFEFTKQARS
jgi:hypothetical protein